MREITVSKNEAGGRLDKLLLKYLNTAEPSFIYKHLRKKNIVLNGKKAQGNVKTKEGDVIKLFFSEDTFSLLKRKSDLNAAGGKDSSVQITEENPYGDVKNLIIYEDENIIAFNKPAGMLSQKSRPGDFSLDDALKEYLGISDMFTPGIANRLDRNTSGIVLAGKNLASQRELSGAISERRIGKIYLCVAKGVGIKHEILDGFLVKDAKTNKVRVYQKEAGSDFSCRQGKNPRRLKPNPSGATKGAARIITEISPVKDNGAFSLLEVNLITGKSHQIRAHLASVGHPVLGDNKYGDRELNLLYKDNFGVSGQLLHSCRVEFKIAGGALGYLRGKKIECPAPEIFDIVLKSGSLISVG